MARSPKGEAGDPREQLEVLSYSLCLRSHTSLGEKTKQNKTLHVSWASDHTPILAPYHLMARAKLFSREKDTSARIPEARALLEMQDGSATPEKQHGRFFYTVTLFSTWFFFS